jgi:hypothetical protein
MEGPGNRKPSVFSFTVLPNAMIFAIETVNVVYRNAHRWLVKKTLDLYRMTVESEKSS